VKLKPIFDTNVFGDVQRGLISASEWQHLLSHRPRRGWPLSQVTALELLAGVHHGGSKGFIDVRRRIEIAHGLSSGRVLEDPRILICKDVLRIPFPSDQMAPAASTASRYLDIVRRAPTLEQLMTRGVPYRGKRIRVRDTSILAELMAGPKRQWVAAVEAMADKEYPEWRDLFRTTGKRLPPDLRREFEPRSAWHAKRPDFIEALLQWFHTSNEPTLVTEMSDRLNAVLEFTIFVTREFLLRNYSAIKHDSDVFDQFQLQYLAMDGFVIVSGDPDLSKRTQQSSQVDRIMSFSQFLQQL